MPIIVHAACAYNTLNQTLAAWLVNHLQSYDAASVRHEWVLTALDDVCDALDALDQGSAAGLFKFTDLSENG